MTEFLILHIEVIHVLIYAPYLTILRRTFSVNMRSPDILWVFFVCDLTKSAYLRSDHLFFKVQFFYSVEKPFVSFQERTAVLSLSDSLICKYLNSVCVPADLNCQQKGLAP